MLVLLRHRYALDKTRKKDFVTLPLDSREAFGLGTKVMQRLRRQLKTAGLIEVKRNAGRPFQYKIISGRQSLGDPLPSCIETQELLQ